MKLTSISVQYSCKFNDPQKRYMNHNYGAEATAELEPGDDPDKAKAALAADLEAFVNGRRTAIYQAAELEAQFTEQKRDFKCALDRVKNYEEGTRRATEEMHKANKLYEELNATKTSLGKLGVSVEMPQACIDLPSAQALPAAAQSDPDEDGNDPDEHADNEAGLDD